MATALSTSIPTPPTHVVLTLTQEEAKVLLQICYNVGGVTSGPRGFIDEISGALTSVGVKKSEHKLNRTYNCIYFAD